MVMPNFIDVMERLERLEHMLEIILQDTLRIRQDNHYTLTRLEERQ